LDASEQGLSMVFRNYVDAVGLHGLASAEAAGLHATEWYALSVLDLAGRLTAGELAAKVGLTTGAATRLIDRLERAGHVRRVADPDDRRRVVVEVATPPDIDAAVGPVRRLLAAVLESYTPEQREVLFDYFARATPAFREATEELRKRT
jgi:DNA-binding Lrp family transcriptional regulator